MRFGVFVFIAAVAATCSQARAEGPRTAVWAETILARLPFASGKLDRERYETFTAAYAADRKAYIDGVFDRLFDKALRDGRTRRADALRHDHDRRLKDLQVGVDLSTTAVLSTLDIDGDGVVEYFEAAQELLRLAEAADLDGNGHLDSDERRLAEWCLNTGTKVVDKNDTGAVRRQFRQMERSEVW